MTGPGHDRTRRDTPSDGSDGRPRLLSGRQVVAQRGALRSFDGSKAEAKGCQRCETTRGTTGESDSENTTSSNVSSGRAKHADGAPQQEGRGVQESAYYAGQFDIRAGQHYIVP